MNEVPEVHAELDAFGHGKVTVNGQDVSGSIMGFELVAGFQQPTRVVLHECARAELAVDAEVTIVRAQLGVEGFLDSVNVEVLEEYALENAHMPTGQAMIAALRRIAQEQVDGG